MAHSLVGARVVVRATGRVGTVTEHDTAHAMCTVLEGGSELQLLATDTLTVLCHNGGAHVVTPTVAPAPHNPSGERPCVATDCRQNDIPPTIDQPTHLNFVPVRATKRTRLNLMQNDGDLVVDQEVADLYRHHRRRIDEDKVKWSSSASSSIADEICASGGAQVSNYGVQSMAARRGSLMLHVDGAIEVEDDARTPRRGAPAGDCGASGVRQPRAQHELDEVEGASASPSTSTSE